MHYQIIHNPLDGLRYPWGLLPAELLFFRWLGKGSVCFPFAFAAGFFWSYHNAPSTLRLLVLGAAAFLIYTIIYLCYSLLIVFILLNRPA